MAWHQNSPYYMRASREHVKVNNIVSGSDIWWGLGGGKLYSWIIHNFIDKLSQSHQVWTLVDFEHPQFIAFSNSEKKEGRYAYLMLPKIQETMPQGAVEFVKKITGRQAYYLFTVHADEARGLVFEGAVFLVAPY